MGCYLALAVALLWHGAAIVGGHSAASYQLQQYDSLRVARCVAQCWAQAPDKKEACKNSCLQSHYTKPGTCPTSGDLSVFDVACIKACSGDPECSGTLKCCTHSCGVTCQRAQGLDSVPGLPPVPVNLSMFERRHGRTVQLDWVDPGAESLAQPLESAEHPGAALLYLLEERHHVGRHLTPERLGAWLTRHRSTRTSATLKNVLRPGRWYQFRVAAVNANGSRGFSEPSTPFKLSLAPKAPGPPLNLSVGSLSRSNVTLQGVLTWHPPVSDLPIQRYKVFWSRRLQGAPSASQGSVLVHHQAVPGEVLRFALKGLEPESLYFLQVQAMAQFGRDRLKSEKAAIFLNTGDHKNVPELPAPPIGGGSRRSARGVAGLRVRRMFWARGQLMARLFWQPPRGVGSRFTVSWQAGPCHGASPVSHKATTQMPRFDVYGLNFRCNYRATVHQVTSDNSIDPHEASLVFTTPACEKLARSQLQDKPPCSALNSRDQQYY